MIDYNSSRSTLIFKEYGRNIQKLVEFAASEKDYIKRQAIADYIIMLMGQMNPHLKNVEMFRHKLWDHLFMISQYKLEVTSPYPETEEPSIIPEHKKLPYPKTNLKFKHYGKNIENLLTKAESMSNEEAKQNEFIRVIGGYMKMVAQNWRDENVDDDVIREDIHFLTKGNLNLNENSNIDRLSDSNKNKRKKKTSNNNNGRNHRQNNNGYRKNNNNNNNYRRR